MAVNKLQETMQNSGVSEIDYDIKIDNISTQKDMQINEETLKVRLNKDHVLVVNKQKFLEKSPYFKLITKSCFADYKS